MKQEHIIIGVTIVLAFLALLAVVYAGAAS